MRGLLLAWLFAAPARGAVAPQDSLLMEDYKMKEAYEAVEAMRPQLDALARELGELRASYAAKTEPDPGGERRTQARAELQELRRQFRVKRMTFKDAGVDQRLNQVVVMAMQFKQGKSELANRSFQTGMRHAQLIGEYKDYDHSLEVVLDEEMAAYQEAVGRWQLQEDARVRRQRAIQGAAAAVVLLPSLFFLGRRLLRSRAKRALDEADGEHLGRWHVGRSPKLWTYGTRWDGADGGSETTASVRLFDERLTAPPSSPKKLLAALKASAPPRHPSISSVTESFTVGNGVAVVYPATAAKPLSLWFEDGRGVKPGQAVVFLRRVAPALDAAHREGRAHGGLEPGCILVGGDGTVTLEDFGLAAALAATGTRSSGSPAYAAPELASSRPTPAADLYSLGILLYELMTGRHPFEGTNLQAMKAEKRYAPLSRAVPGCPPALDVLLDGLLEPDPARRRPAPGGLEAALKAL